MGPGFLANQKRRGAGAVLTVQSEASRRRSRFLACRLRFFSGAAIIAMAREVVRETARLSRCDLRVPPGRSEDPGARRRRKW
jgi:hypothetical protein